MRRRRVLMFATRHALQYRSDNLRDIVNYIRSASTELFTKVISVLPKGRRLRDGVSGGRSGLCDDSRRRSAHYTCPGRTLATNASAVECRGSPDAFRERGKSYSVAKR